ncbi:MAG TPA: cytochrome C [Sulfurovum sp. UBA12169]|nr:MAG TPA: cytochrome C [Sulfurovum sp. UBA12169]
MAKTIALWGIAFLLLLQTVQIEISTPSAIDPKREIDAPKEIIKMLKVSCYDCHSYQTKMPWYANVAPFSWSVRSHIKKGRNWFNFQEWNSYDEEKKQKIYKGIAETISYSMPMPMYLSFHDEAKLTQQERNRIKKWAQNNIKDENE